MSTNHGDPTHHLIAVTADADYADRMVAELGRGRGFEVSIAGTVAEAMAMLRENDGVDCIVSDHEIPDVDAIAFLQMVRIERPDLPFLLFTTEGDETLASRAIHAGVTEYLPRESEGFQWDKLANLVDGAIAFYRSLGESKDRQSDAIPLFHAMPDMVVVLQDGAVQFVNRRGCELLGLAAEEIVGRRFVGRFVHENGLTAAGLRDIQAGTTFVGGMAATLVDAHGRDLSVEVTAAQTGWLGSDAIAVVLVDRSERAKLERESRNLARINDVVSEVNHLIISAEDRESLEAAVCSCLADSDPYRLAWIGGVDDADDRIVPREWAGHEAGYFDEIEITVGSEPTGQGPTGLAVQTMETQVTQNVANDARFYPWRDEALDRGYRSSAAVPLRSEGQFYGILNLYADRPRAFDEEELGMLEILAGDIAFAIRALEDRTELERSQQRLSMALDAAKAGVWTWNLDSDSVTVDDGMALLTGLEVTEGRHAAGTDHSSEPAYGGVAVGTFADFLDRIHPEDRRLVEREIRFASRQGTDFEVEFRVQLAHAADHWLVTLGKPVRGDGDQPTSVIGVAVDITERKERDLHLRVIDRVLRHNLRNDLNVISGGAETIAATTSGKPATQAEKILEHANRLLRTAEKEREIVELLTEPPLVDDTDLAALIGDVAKRVRDRFSATTITVETPSSLPTTTVTDRFDRAIEELLVNAVEHSDRDHPRITVTLTATDDRSRIRITDDGPDIPEMNLGVLTGESEEPLYHGSGLGLWLVHWIVRRSDGTLGFEGNEPRGNVVTIDLPTVDHRPSEAGHEEHL